MKYLICRGDLEAAGLNAAEQAWTVEDYDVATGRQMPAPWQEFSPGVWSAPGGTPPPPLGTWSPPDADAARAWLNDEKAGSPWIGVEELTAELTADGQDSSRYLLARPDAPGATAPPDAWPEAAATFDLTRRSARRHVGAWLPPRRVHAGRVAAAAIAAAYPPNPGGWPKDVPGAAAALAQLTGTPIVLDDTLPANVWRLVDPATGGVLYEGTAGPDLSEYVRVIRECVEQLADEAGTPRDLLF